MTLGETLETLTQAGLAVKKISETHAEVVLPASASGGGTLQLSLCEGKIIDIWINDLRFGPDCVTYQEKPVARATPRTNLEALLGNCQARLPHLGITIESCAGGGVHLGYWMDNYLQIHVRPRGFASDNTCAIASDDGRPIELPAASRAELLQEILNLPQLGQYWHADTPGRTPLQIVKTPLVPPTEFKMFGSPVVWIDFADAQKGSAYFTITRFKSTRTRTTIDFAYPIERLVGRAIFLHVDDRWKLDWASIDKRG